MAKGNRPSGNKAEKPTNARRIGDMNEAQLKRKIKATEEHITRLEKDVERYRHGKEIYGPGITGGSGWSPARKRQFDRDIAADTRRAVKFNESLNALEGAKADLKRYQDARKAIAGTGKTMNQIKEERQKATIQSAPKTLKWKTTQKEEYTGSTYRPKIISAGAYEIRGRAGMYSIYKNGQRLGGTDKLSKAKAFVELDNQKGK